jgi:dolichol kinase
VSDEVKRRLVHVSGTAAPASYLLDLLTWQQLQLLLLAGSLAALALETIRLFVGLDWAIYDELTREYEQDNLAGYALYMFGMTAVALGFDPQVAVPAMLMLTIADPISGLLGAGQLRPVKRGSILLITFGVCIVIASLFVPPAAAVLGAVVATLADGAKPVISGYVIDDNITIPIGAAVAMFVGLQYLSWIGF